jgi:hypothetical protein
VDAGKMNDGFLYAMEGKMNMTTLETNGGQNEIYDRPVLPRCVCSSEKTTKTCVPIQGSNPRPLGPEARVFPLCYVRSSNMKWF